MNTAVLIGSSPGRIATRSLPDEYPGSSKRTTSLVVPPALKETRKSKPIIVPFSVSKADPEASSVRVRIPKGAVWELLELGFMLVLGASVLASVFLSLLAAGNM